MVFFGMSKDKTVYVFSKDDQFVAPTITPVINKIKHTNEERNQVGFMPVSSYKDNDTNTLGVEINQKTGQRVKDKNNSGYYNKVKNE